MGRKGKKIKSEEQEETVDTDASVLVAIEPPKPLAWWQITTEEDYDLNQEVAVAYEKYIQTQNPNKSEIKNTSSEPITFRKIVPILKKEEEEEEEEDTIIVKKRLKNGKFYERYFV